MSWVEPSLKRPEAVNCCNAPRMTVGFEGLTVTLWMVALDTVKVVEAGVKPPYEPEMLTDPAERP